MSFDHPAPARVPARRHPAVTWGPPALLALLLILFFFSGGSHQALRSPDEGRYLGIARSMLLDHDWIVPRLNGIPFLDKPPLFYWLSAASMAAFGFEEAWMRFTPKVMGIIGCMVVFLVARQAFGLLAALLAAAILATSDPALAARLDAWRAAQTASVPDSPA